MDNQFDSKGGEQNVGQGDHAIGKQVNNSGVPPALFAEYTAKLAVTDSALVSFFKIIEQEKVPPGDLDSKLREIAANYKELLQRMETVQSEDPQVVKLKEQARQAIEAGNYAKAEELLNQAKARDVQAIELQKKSIREQQKALEKRQLSAAASSAGNASLQRIQLRYAKAAEYWQEAAALLPEDKKKERAFYLNEAGYDLHRIGKYKEALPLFEQSLAISQEIGDKAVEGTTLGNIGTLHHAKGDYATALKYLEQSLRIMQEIGNKAGEGTTLNNISQIYKARGDYATALKYLEQSLRITQEIGDKAQEAVTSWNIGAMTYKKRKAEPYISRAVQLAEEIGHPKLKEWRKALEAVRAKLRGK